MQNGSFVQIQTVAMSAQLASALISLKLCSEAFAWFNARGSELLRSAAPLGFEDWQELHEKADWLFINFLSDHVTKIYLAILDRGTVDYFKSRRKLDDRATFQWFRDLCELLKRAHARRFITTEEYRKRIDCLAVFLQRETHFETGLRHLAAMRHPDDELAQELYLAKHSMG